MRTGDDFNGYSDGEEDLVSKGEREDEREREYQESFEKSLNT